MLYFPSSFSLEEQDGEKHLTPARPRPIPLTVKAPVEKLIPPIPMTIIRETMARFLGSVRSSLAPTSVLFFFLTSRLYEE